MKEKPDRKKINKQTKTKKANYVLQHVRTDSRCMWMKSVLNLSWRRSLLCRNQSIDLQSKSIDWFLYDKNFRHERVTALLPPWLLLDCDKLIDIHASKYQRRMLLINPLSKNQTVETFNATKTHKAYIDFGIFSLYFVIVNSNTFRFASTN